MKPISQVAQDLGIPLKLVRPYGEWKAKISLENQAQLRKRGKLVLVSAMTPTPSGEGKTVTAIGLAMGLNKIGQKAVVCLRQPSLGPLFGVKGGAAGGGKSTVEPTQDINMRFNGDIDAVSASHNLLSALLDNHLHHGNELGIDSRTITWKRVLDMNDRALRHTVIGLGGKKDGVPREDGFNITAASEVMAIHGLAKNYQNLKDRLGRIIVGSSNDGNPIRAVDLKASGSMAAILRDALEPNLAQTAEGTPALIHGGPFGNIAHGTCSLVSINLGLSLSDYCVVETGFATDLGAEKFFDIVSRIGGFNVDVAVIVASVKAIKHHGSTSPTKTSSSVDLVVSGLANLEKHIENIRIFGLEPIVSLNRFPTDLPEEIQVVEDFCQRLGVPFAISTVFESGGEGGIELASAVVEASKENYTSKSLYELKESVEQKLEKIVYQVYGGSNVEYSEDARKDLRRISKLELTELPICVAKTASSLSDDPTKLGRPRDFSVVVRGFGVAAGAGFNVEYMGDIVTMPGLPKHPAAENIDLTDDGRIIGLH